MTEFRAFVAACGGVSSFAKECGVAPTTVYKWWERGTVPSRKAFTILRIARDHEVPLTNDDVEAWVVPERRDTAA